MRSGRWLGGLKLRLERWFYRNRPRISVAAAFGAACLLGLVAASMGVNSLAPASPGSDAPAAATP